MEIDEKKVENRGGARPGAGRKPIFDLSHEQRKQIIEDVTAVAQKNGTSFGTELGKLMFEPGTDKRAKISAMKLYVGDVLAKISEKEININDLTKPQIFVPDKYPDSADAPEYRPTH